MPDTSCNDTHILPCSVFVYNMKIKFSYDIDTDVNVMRGLYLAVMHKCGQQVCMTAKHTQP